MERSRNSEVVPLSPRSEVELTSALLATGFPYVRDETVDLNTGLVRDFLKDCCHGVRRGGSAAIDLAHVGAYWWGPLMPPEAPG